MNKPVSSKQLRLVKKSTTQSNLNLQGSIPIQKHIQFTSPRESTTELNSDSILSTKKVAKLV